MQSLDPGACCNYVELQDQSENYGLYWSFLLVHHKSRNLFCCVEEHVSLSSPTLSQTLRFGRFSSQFVSTKFMLMPWLSWRQTCAQSGVIRHAGRNYLKLESECFANWRLHHTLIFCIFENKFKTKPKWNVFRLSKSKVNLMFWCLNYITEIC